MEIEKLRSFMEVYNCRSISKAAENLYISQSALSRRIQSLESELKLELFKRDGSALTPTEGAEVLYKEANKLLRQYTATKIKMSQLKNGEAGVLHIGILDSMLMSPTLHAISRMQSNYPDIEMTFDCDQNTNVSYSLIRKQIDVGVTVYGEISGIEGLKYEILGQNTLAVLVGRNHRLWKKRPLYLEDLSGETLYYTTGVAEQTLASVGQYVKNQNISFGDRIPCRSSQELLLYMASGKGVAFVGVIANELFESVRDVVDVVPLENTALKQGYTVAVYDVENDMAARFVEILKQCW